MNQQSRNVDYSDLREQMVKDQLLARGISNPRVIQAMRHIKRHNFVPLHLLSDAYKDSALPIGFGQTISQPYIVAHIAELLDLSPTDTVFEVGAGSGYQAAVISRLANRVITVESIASLVNAAQNRFVCMGINNVFVFEGDGGMGMPEQGPYDAILISAASPRIPCPLILQLKFGGRLVAPIGSSSNQNIVLYKRLETHSTKENLTPVRFVPLTGKWGF
jgi:protein-L-isoaspartate(D-aspartate) O-methyltransferase